MAEKGGFTTFIGAVAGLITAIGTLIVILNQVGLLGTPKSNVTTKPQTEQTLPSANQPSNSQRVQELENKITELDDDEAAAKEEEMLKRIEELEKQLKAKQQKAVSNNQTEPASSINLTGYWTDAYSGGLYQINQFGTDISLKEFVNYFGVQTITSDGYGSISGKQVKIDYNTLFNTSGSATLKIQNNGNRLTGTATDHYTKAVIQLDLTRN